MSDPFDSNEVVDRDFGIEGLTDGGVSLGVIDVKGGTLIEECWSVSPGYRLIVPAVQHLQKTRPPFIQDHNAAVKIFGAEDFV
jgi:hypothetical protein